MKGAEDKLRASAKAPIGAWSKELEKANRVSTGKRSEGLVRDSERVS
jgi:hypothetical protein